MGEKLPDRPPLSGTLAIAGTHVERIMVNESMTKRKYHN